MNAPFAVPATVDLTETGSPPSRTRAYAQIEAAQVGPLPLPALSRAAARTSRTIGDARFAPFARAQLGAQTIDVRVIDTNRTQAHAADFADPAIVEIALSARDSAEFKPASLRIALDLQAYPALAIVAVVAIDAVVATGARDDTPGAHGDAAEHALRDAVAGVLLEPMLTRIGEVLACDARLVSVRRATLQADVQIALSFTTPIDTATPTLHTLRIAACSRALDLIDARLRAPDTHPTSGAPIPDFPALALPGSLIVGMKPLDVQTLRSLDVGDVLLRALFPSWTAATLAASDTPQQLESQLYDEDDAPDAPPASSARPRALAAWGTPGLARLIAEIAFDGPAPVILKEPNMSEELDPANVDAGLAVDQPDNPIHIGELELPVQFEIDTVALPLAQLSTLGPGYVVELPVPVADARLRLVAHGQTIGYGELVTVGEHLGIRIIRMAHRHGPVQ
ncbi:type III secretion system cytoplasmic ring protein SctQ [Paraburkholderia tropica]|uniref:type III secretion system cytoplasmic ring protein SctQ n=1 Tax=Paraburkholderia tropica TaxID=92647 RepID=UPI002AB215F7|nr:type III secretion system cytoplasmic ring protein SctQ [Paraburkholderia tropica]